MKLNEIIFAVHLHHLTFTIQQHFTFWKAYEDLTALVLKNMSSDIFVASLYVKDNFFSCYELRELIGFKRSFYSILYNIFLGIEILFTVGFAFK